MEIAEWAGSREAVPSNKQLGIETEIRRSDNWGGRLDEYCVDDGCLILRYVLLNPRMRNAEPKQGLPLAPDKVPERWRRAVPVVPEDVASGRTIFVELNAPILLDGTIVCRRAGDDRRVELLRFAGGHLAAASSAELPTTGDCSVLIVPRGAATVVLQSVGPDRKAVWRALSDAFRGTVPPETRRAWLDAPPAVILRDEATLFAERLVFSLRSAGAVVDFVFAGSSVAG